MCPTTTRMPSPPSTGPVRPLAARGLLFRCVGIAIAAGMSLVSGCAAPVQPARNVVFDADVRDCETGAYGELGSLDVVIVLDTSQSMGRPSGVDLDGDGVVHDTDYDRGRVRGDSRLAAQIEAARALVARTQGEDVRFSLVTYSGPSIPHTAGRTRLVGSQRDSSLLVSLTKDRAALDAALADLLAAGAEGKTIFYAGMRRATRELTIDLPRAVGWRRKLVLLISDSPEPTGLASDGKFMNVDWRMKHAAVKARQEGIVIHTFGLSPAAPAWRRRPLGRIAGATGGTYHPVEDPRRLACHLTTSLQPPQRYVRRTRAFAATQPEATASEAGSARPEAGSSRPEAGSSRPEAGSAGLEASVAPSEARGTAAEERVAAIEDGEIRP